MKQVTRRSFLMRTGVSAAALASSKTINAAESPLQIPSASDQVTLALVGCGGRGRYVMRGLVEQGARVTHLCDLMPGRLDEVESFLGEVQTAKPKKVQDLRRVLDAAEVDAVIVATPDHWHGPASILACRAGKDVYVEKPHAHNIWESEKMIEAARKYRRILQVGTQNRSGPYNLQALDYVRNGNLGKICLVKVFNMKPGGPFHLGDAGSVPADFDWNMWLGRAPWRPYHQRLFHGGWHHFWDFSGGDMADDGIHQIDLALMIMGDPGFPRSVRCLGGRYAHRGDDSQQPDVQVVSYDYGDFVMTFELTEYPRYMQKTTATIRRNDEFPYWTQNATRIEFYGSERMMILGRHGGGWVVMTSGGKVVDKVYGRPADDPHYSNFLQCVKSREKPNADVAIAHTSNAAMHMGNLALRAGNTTLRYNPDSHRFDQETANQIMTPVYRQGFEIPDPV